MYRNCTISVCLPCRNEGKHLTRVLRTVPSIVDETIVISNASTDNSVEVARSAGAVVLEDNRKLAGIGYGFAHMTGIAAAKGDIIVGIDADGTYPIEVLKDVVDHLLDNELDFISCSRTQLSKIPFKLRLGVWLLNTEIRLLYGRRITDTLSGMWVFRRDARSQLNLDQGDWNLSPQIKIEAMLQAGIRFGEYPVIQKHRFGTSHQRYFHTGFSHARWIWKNRLVGMQSSSASPEPIVGEDIASDS
jgi:glycosyltransferase involved in cell wall biosynthesis